MGIEQSRENKLELGCSAIEGTGTLTLLTGETELERAPKNKFCLIPNFAKYKFSPNIFLG